MLEGEGDSICNRNRDCNCTGVEPREGRKEEGEGGTNCESATQGRRRRMEATADLRYSLYCPLARCKPLRLFVFLFLLVSRLVSLRLKSIIAGGRRRKKKKETRESPFFSLLLPNKRQMKARMHTAHLKS